MEDSGFLFPSAFIKKENEQDLIARPLHISDFEKGISSFLFPPNIFTKDYCKLLNQLTDVEYVDKKMYEARFREWQLAK